MKLKIIYFSIESIDFEVEKFQSDLIDFSILSNTNDLNLRLEQDLVDVILIDEEALIENKDLQKMIQKSNQWVNVYYLLHEFDVKNIEHLIQQTWIDKIIPVTNQSGFVINDSVLKKITHHSQMLLDHKQLLQDNRELEFVISQMMLID